MLKKILLSILSEGVGGTVDRSLGNNRHGQFQSRLAVFQANRITSQISVPFSFPQLASPEKQHRSEVQLSERQTSLGITGALLMDPQGIKEALSRTPMKLPVHHSTIVQRGALDWEPIMPKATSRTASYLASYMSVNFRIMDT